MDAVVEKITKARGPGHPHRMMKVMRAPTAAYNIEDWMWGLEEDTPKVEVRNGDAINCIPEQRNAHSQHAGQGSRQCRRQGRPQFPRDTSGGSPSSEGGSSKQGSNWKFPAVNHDGSVQRKYLTSVGRKGSQGEGQFANLQG